MTFDTEARTERLFETERLLRVAAVEYRRDLGNETRVALRKAAIAYANAADECDRAISAPALRAP